MSQEVPQNKWGLHALEPRSSLRGNFLLCVLLKTVLTKSQTLLNFTMAAYATTGLLTRVPILAFNFKRSHRAFRSEYLRQHDNVSFGMSLRMVKVNDCESTAQSRSAR